MEWNPSNSIIKDTVQELLISRSLSSFPTSKMEITRGVKIYRYTSENQYKSLKYGYVDTKLWI